MIRLFIAIPLPEEVQMQLHAMGLSLPGAKAIPENQIHLTLRFIGEVEGTTLKDIKESLKEIEAPVFPLAVQGVGHFPPRGKPRVLWAGVQPAEPLTRLKRKIDTILIGCGIGPDSRKYHPHVTFARLHDPPMQRLTSFLAGNAFLSFEGFQVESFLLFSSILSPKGARHRVEAEYQLVS